jgi:Membrane-bound metallopeptidase
MAKKIQRPEPEAVPTSLNSDNWNSGMAAFAREQQAKKERNLDDVPLGELPSEWQGEGDPRIWLHPSRAAATPDTDAQPDVAAVETAAMDMVREARETAPALAQAEADETAAVNQMVGMVIFGQGMEITAKLAKLRVLGELKKAKNYKNVPIKNAQGEIVRPKNFEELCEAFGMARASVDRDLENIAVFGEGVLMAQKTLGIGYRQLSALRGTMGELPDAQQEQVRELIADAAQSNDKEVVLAALDEIGARNAKLSKERDEALAQVEAQKKVQSKTAKRANELEIRLEQALNPSSEDERQKNLADARAALRGQLDTECNALVGLVSTLCNHVGNVRKADTERDADPVIDATMWEHINNRVSIMVQSMDDLIQSAGLDVNVVAEFDPEAWTGMRGEPDDFMPETEESQQ